MKHDFIISRKLNKKVKNVEKKHRDYISYVLDANFHNEKHIMLVEDKDLYLQIYNTVKQELEPLETVDLLDFNKIGEYGRSNKKRRNLLC